MIYDHVSINYTIMGDVVNLAARLEGIGKVYGVSTLISHHTYERVQGVIEARLLDTIRLGQGEPVKVYELLGRKGHVALDRAEAARLFTRGYASAVPIKVFWHVVYS